MSQDYVFSQTRWVKSTVKHHSSFQLAELESQNDRARKGLKRPHSTIHRPVGTPLCSQVKHKKQYCLIQARYWHLKMLSILCLFPLTSLVIWWDTFPLIVNMWTGFPQCSQMWLQFNLLLFLATAVPLSTLEHDWPRDWFIAVLSTITAIYLVLLAQTFLHILTMNDSQKAQTGYTYNHWLTADLRSTVKYWRTQWS